MVLLLPMLLYYSNARELSSWLLLCLLSTVVLFFPMLFLLLCILYVALVRFIVDTPLVLLVLLSFILLVGLPYQLSDASVELLLVR